MLAMHSSFRSVGPVERGAETLIDSVLDALGPDGTLMVPTHTYNYCLWSTRPYDRDETPSRVGALTELIRRRDGAHRSLHPTHSVAAIGADAAALTQGHLNSSPTGPGCPWDRLRLAGGDVLMLGTRLDTCTIIHLAECLAETPYLDVTFISGERTMTAFYVDGRGVKTYVQLSQIPGCSANFNAVMPLLDAAGLLRRGKVGNSDAMLMPAREGVDTIVAALRERPDMLLCNRPECQLCPHRKQVFR